MHLHWPAIMKLQVLEKLHIVPDYFMTERFFIFSRLVKVTCLTSATVKSVGRGHRTYIVVLSLEHTGSSSWV